MDHLQILDTVELTDDHRDRPESILLCLHGAFEGEGGWGTVEVHVVGEERADVNADQVQPWGCVIERHEDLFAAAAAFVASATGKSIQTLDLGMPVLTFWSTVETTDPVEWCVHFQECSAYQEAGVIVFFSGDTPTELCDPAECDSAQDSGDGS